MQEAGGLPAHPGKTSVEEEGVLLSIEPVHVYTDSDAGDVATASGSAVSGLEREKRLKDVTANGHNVFHEAQPSAAQLGEDVRRLWQERGDFLRFNTQALVDRIARKSRKRKLLKSKSKRDGSGSSDEEDAISSVSDQSSEDENDKNTDKAGQKQEQDQHASSIGGTIKESDFVVLRDQVLSRLDVAHFSSIHAHQLLGMLIKAHKPLNVTHGPGGAKLSSPAPSLGAGSIRSTSVARAAQPATAQALAPLGIFANLASGSKEEEFVLDPLAISLSRTSLNTAVSSRRNTNADVDNQDDASDDELDPSDPGYGIAQAKKELESSAAHKEDKVRDFKIALSTKREALRSAADLLEAGANELRSCQSSERERWRGLIGLRNRGWGFSPGRPLLDMERFGDRSLASKDDDDTNDSDKEDESKKADSQGKKDTKKEGAKEKTKVVATGNLQGFGTPVLAADGKVKEEGARDAWIGFGLPEAPIELRRRTLAYWADTTTHDTNTPSLTPANEKLIFPDRPRRRLCVNFVLWPTKKTEKKAVWTSDRPLSSTASNGDNAIPITQVLDEDLQQASREASDELVFGDVVSQARQLGPAFGVRLTSSTVRIILTATLDLVVRLVPTDTVDAEHPPEEEPRPDHSPFATLMLAFLRSSPLRKWNAFANATLEARMGDINAKALAIRSMTLSAPRRQTSSSLFGNASNAGNQTSGRDAHKGGSDSTDSSPVPKGDSVGPILVTLHYWSFVSQLHELLRRLQRETNDVGQTQGRCQVDFVPLHCSDADASRQFLAAFMEAAPHSQDLSDKHALALLNHSRQQGSQGQPHSRAAPNLPNLSGYAKVWLGGNLICTLDFAQPSELTARFQANAVGGASTSTGTGAGQLLQLDLATLDELLRRQVAHSL